MDERTFTQDDWKAVATGRIFREHYRKPLLYFGLPWLTVAVGAMLAYSIGAGKGSGGSTEWAMIGLFCLGVVVMIAWASRGVKKYLRSGRYTIPPEWWEERDLRNVLDSRMGVHYNHYFWRFMIPWWILGMFFIWLPSQFRFLYPGEVQMVLRLFLIGIVLLAGFGVWIERKTRRREREEIRSISETRRSKTEQMEPGA